jgi:hypothetical protein
MIETIKRKWKVILALVAVAIFIFEMIAIGVLGGGSGGGGTTAGDIQTGTAEFSGVIRTYDPVLVATPALDEGLANELRAMEGVKDVSPSAEGTVINTETRDDVYPIAMYLREKNVTTYGVANIAMPPFVEVEFGNGSAANASAGNVAIRIVTEPIVDADTEVRITMIAQVRNGMLYDYGSPLIVTEEEEVEVESTVLSVKYIYTCLIPWEKRNSVSLENLTGADYQIKNTVLFGQPLTVDEVMEKKTLEYVEYIDQYSIECDENFTNITAVENDFGNVTFPDSVLTVVSNESVELEYEGSVVYSYVFSLPSEADGITLETSETELESDRFYAPDSTVMLQITGTVVGDRMVTIDNIVLKES